MNAPEAGTIKEFLAKEEDTVEVGQDLVRMEAGEGGKKEATEQPKEPAPADQKKSSDPQEEGKPSKDEQKPPPEKSTTSPPPEKSTKPPPPPPKQESKPPPPKQKDEKSEQKPPASPFGAGTRTENKVCQFPITISIIG